MKLYIHGSGCISPQQSWGDISVLSNPISYSDNKLRCIEPDYSQYVDVKAIRRMSRIIKMGVASATMALKQANVDIPDAIITGTGYGCLEDTGIFLTKMIENKEQALNPTPFIQSTHNTIGSQIALLLQCQGYNQTFSQGAFSFENALMDARIQAEDAPQRNILVGGVDEITNISHSIQNRFGLFRENVGASLNLINEEGNGTLNGEGSAFFVVSGSDTGASACIENFATLYKPDRSKVRELTLQWLETSGYHPSDIDLVLLGKSGNVEHDDLLISGEKLFPTSSLATFKNLCGEFPVASAFAVWIATEVMKHQRLPSAVINQDKGRPLKKILIYNQYFGSHHSMILLNKC